MKIISKRELVVTISYQLFFQRTGEFEGSGFAAQCNEKGVLLHRHLNECIVNCLRELKATGTLVGEQYEKPVVVKNTHGYRKPAVGECDCCGRHVTLSGFTNTCECGADYNMSGSMLASRSQWGEETGEHLSDILRIR